MTLPNLFNLSDQMYWCSLCPLRIRWLQLLRIQTEPLTTVTNSRMPWCGISESCGAEIRITYSSNHNCNKLFIDRKSNPRKSKPLLQKNRQFDLSPIPEFSHKILDKTFWWCECTFFDLQQKNCQGCLEKPKN